MLPRPTLAALFSLGLVTAATLAEQVVITRLFSAALAYHFGFLAISVALLGTGAAALLVYVRPAWFAGDRALRFSRWSVVLSASLILAPLILVRLDFSGIDALSMGFTLNLAVACIVAAIPPFASGAVVALAIAEYRTSIGVVYAFDLVGAGLGALGVVPLLWFLPAPALLVVLGAVTALASLIFGLGVASPRSRGQTAGSLIALCAALGVLGLSARTNLLYLEPRYELPETAKAVGEHWTPIGRAIGYDLGPEHNFALLFYDRVYAPVPIVRDGPPPGWKELAAGPASIGFALIGKGRTLVIGGGGGRDIYNALSAGQSPVDVIELSEANRRVVDEDLGYLSGKPYSRPSVNTVIGDGRSVLAARATKYDQIHIGFTDTLSANAAQGFALTENNLYTVEAFDEYLDHLAPRGILNVSRLLKLVGDEALRVTVLTVEALRRRGVADPFQNVIVILGSDILGPPIGTVLARLEPFTPEEVATVRRLAVERANGLLLVPGGPNRGAWADLASARSIQDFCSNYALDVCPPTDDRPFFFHMGRLGDFGRQRAAGYHYSASPVAVLLVTLGILAVMSLLGLVLPLRLVRSERAPDLRSLAYFGCIGIGFLLFEMVLIQRFVLFLGYPTYALSVVLFALLVFSGVGSFISGRVKDGEASLLRALALAVCLIAVSAIGLGPVLERAMTLPLPLRIALSGVLLAPFGLLFGMAMPLGLSRFADSYPDSVAYAWGINGIASVLASVLGAVLALHLGFSATSFAAGAMYLLAFVVVLSQRRRVKPATTHGDVEPPESRERDALESSSSRAVAVGRSSARDQH